MDKRVVVYCTGGVRCEKFSGWMVREGYKDVGQLHGGIATYGKDPSSWRIVDGKMYVFDERIAVDVNHLLSLVRTGSMAHHVSAMSTVAIHSVTAVF